MWCESQVTAEPDTSQHFIQGILSIIEEWFAISTSEQKLAECTLQECLAAFHK